MNPVAILLQFACQNVALVCCALFAGAATYVSLVEQPSLEEGGARLADAFTLASQPRPVIFKTFFAVAGSVAGIITTVAGGSLWWCVGGIVLALAAAVQVIAVRPLQRDLIELDLRSDPPAAAGIVTRLARLHGMLTLAGLAALFMYITST